MENKRFYIRFEDHAFEESRINQLKVLATTDSFEFATTALICVKDPESPLRVVSVSADNMADFCEGEKYAIFFIEENGPTKNIISHRVAIAYGKDSAEWLINDLNNYYKGSRRFGFTKLEQSEKAASN